MLHRLSGALAAALALAQSPIRVVSSPPPACGPAASGHAASVYGSSAYTDQRLGPPLLLPRQHTICRQVIDCSIKQTKLICSRDNGPGIDTGDILCEG